ncbi:hypothetical protein [Rhodopirellula bahusiensis]|uniref:hypothetical protein n=1 Tax=Rhodopirellula bahusiensis TaxID=2014065 RepID=UPI00117A38FF|nr:hypothetical protein [Rhodopirellula bahusiensis]
MVSLFNKFLVNNAGYCLGLLILGETEFGLDALHAAQTVFEQNGERGALLQSLENELRLLEHEGRGIEANQVRQKIQLIEQA